MAATQVITTICRLAGAALSPEERWTAMRNLQQDNPLLHQGFIMAGLIAIGLLIILLVIVHYGQRWKETRESKNWFAEFSLHNGLSSQEQDLLRVIIDKAGVKQLDSIFTMPAAFDKGVNELLVENAGGANEHFAEQIESELVRLRSKLGFGAQVPAMASRRGKMSSRQIPLGKTINLSRRKTRVSEPLEGVLVHNDEIEFAVKIPVELKVHHGEVWILQYNFGPSVCEFDAPLVRAIGDEYVFGHSDSIRFVSRRRFLRVEIDTKALVAVFPFERGRELQAPVFRHASIRQLAGPGLLLETDMMIELGRRVLVIAELPGGKVIEDIGEVRHVRKIHENYSIAVELVGLGEADVDELIRATNAAARIAKTGVPKETEAPVEIAV